MKIVAMAAVVLATVLSAENSVTGKWDIQTEVMGNVGSAVCTLKQDGATISGKCTMGEADQTVTGQITDNKITFKHGAEYNGEALTINYTGKFDSEKALSGDVTVDPFGVSGTFKATRKAE
jgi:hypothetical protein